MRVAVLTPAPDFWEPWNWAYDSEAAALRAAGFDVEPLAWTEARYLERFDAVLPLVVWGYHFRFAQWHALLDRLEGCATPTFNPPALLRWNSDKSYLEQLAASGVATVRSRTGRRSTRTRWPQPAPTSVSNWWSSRWFPRRPMAPIGSDPATRFPKPCAASGC